MLLLQRQGLAWMINMEHPTLPVDVDAPPVQLWVKKLDLQVRAYPLGKPPSTNHTLFLG